MIQSLPTRRAEGMRPSKSSPRTRRGETPNILAASRLGVNGAVAVNLHLNVAASNGFGVGWVRLPFSYGRLTARQLQ